MGAHCKVSSVLGHVRELIKVMDAATKNVVFKNAFFSLAYTLLDEKAIANHTLSL